MMAVSAALPLYTLVPAYPGGQGPHVFPDRIIWGPEVEWRAGNNPLLGQLP